MSIHARPGLATQTDSSVLFLEKMREVMRVNNFRASDGSPLANDAEQSHHREGVWQGELYEQSDAQAIMALLASSQDLHLAVEDAGRRPAAFLVLVRGALEAAASANYLASPDIDAISERARRGLNEMLSGCFQQWRALKEYDQLEDADVKWRLMNNWLEKAASYPDLGSITRAHERSRPNAPYVGDSRPTISALIDFLFPSGDGRRFGRWLYSAVSAPAHTESHGYAIAAGQVINADGTQGIVPEGEMSSDRVARFAITSLVAIYQAVTSVFARYGWPLADVQVQCDMALSAWHEKLS